MQVPGSEKGVPNGGMLGEFCRICLVAYVLEPFLEQRRAVASSGERRPSPIFLRVKYPKVVKKIGQATRREGCGAAERSAKKYRNLGGDKREPSTTKQRREVPLEAHLQEPQNAAH